MSTIRRAVDADIPALVAMGERFLRETSYAALITPDRERLTQTITGFLARPDWVLLVSETAGSVTGMIALMRTEHPFSGESLALEMVWWVEPEARGAGVKLLKAAERWASDSGARTMQVVAPTLRVGAFYERMGYVPVETAYQRTLGA